MKQWKGTKCEPGYIERQKRFQAVMLLVFAAIGIGLFLIGYLATGTRANGLPHQRSPLTNNLSCTCRSQHRVFSHLLPGSPSPHAPRQ